MVSHVTGSEDAFDAGCSRVAFTAAMHHQITVFQGQLAFEQRSVRGVADGDEHAVDGNFVEAAIVVLQTRTGHAHVVAQHFVEVGVQLEDDLALGDASVELVDQDLLGAEGFATVDQGHGAGDVCEVQCFFNSGVAAADHCNRLVAVEETVAGRAGRNAFAHERFFRRQTQVTSAGAGSDDQGIAGVGRAVAGQGVRLGSEVDGVDVIENDLGFKALGVLAHTLHQHRASQTVDVARPVVDFGGGGQLTASLHAGDQQWLEVGAGRVYRSAVTGRAGTENNHSRMTDFRHDLLLLTGPKNRHGSPDCRRE